MFIINTEHGLRVFNSNQNKSNKFSVLTCLNHQLTCLTLGLFLLTTYGVSTAQAQPVSDNENTIVDQNGNQFDIKGGERSGVNLFHSFEKFGLNKDQIAEVLIVNKESNKQTEK